MDVIDVWLGTSLTHMNFEDHLKFFRESPVLYSEVFRELLKTIVIDQKASKRLHRSTVLC